MKREKLPNWKAIPILIVTAVILLAGTHNKLTPVTVLVGLVTIGCLLLIWFG